MPIQVQYEGSDYEFPDGTSEQQIASMLRKAAPLLPKQQKVEAPVQQERGWFGKVKDAGVQALNNTYQGLAAGLALSGSDDWAVEKIAELERNRLPDSREMREFMEANGYKAAIAEIFNDAKDVIPQLMASGAGSSVTAIAGGLLGAAAGPVGAVAGLGAGSAVAEGGSEFLDTFRKAGVDLRDPNQIRQAFQNQELVSEAKVNAAKKGLVVGAVDAATAGALGKLLRFANAAGKGSLFKWGTGTALEATGGATGEVASEAALGREASAPSVLAEALTEAFMTAPEAVVVARDAVFKSATKKVSEAGMPAAAAAIERADQEVQTELKPSDIPLEELGSTVDVQEVAFQPRETPLPPVEQAATPEAPQRQPEPAAPATVPTGTPEIQPTPEPPQNLAAQLTEVVNPDSTKPGMLVTPGETTPELPDDVGAVKTKWGTYVYNPAKIGEDEIQGAIAESGDQFPAELLGMSATVAEGDAVVETSAGGVPVQQEAVDSTDPAAVQAAVEAGQAAVPGGETVVKPIEQVLQEREEANAQEQVAAPSALPTQQGVAPVQAPEGQAQAGVAQPEGEGQAEQATLEVGQPTPSFKSSKEAVGWWSPKVEQGKPLKLVQSAGPFRDYIIITKTPKVKDGWQSTLFTQNEDGSFTPHGDAVYNTWSDAFEASLGIEKLTAGGKSKVASGSYTFTPQLEGGDRRGLQEAQEAKEDVLTPQQQATQTETPATPLQQAKQELKDAWNDLQTLGAVADPKVIAEKNIRLYKALFNLAVEAIKQGVKTLKDFVAKYQVVPGAPLDENNAAVKSAWEAAVAGQKEPETVPSGLDEALKKVSTVADIKTEKTAESQTALPTGKEEGSGTYGVVTTEEQWKRARERRKKYDTLDEAFKAAVTNPMSLDARTVFLALLAQEAFDKGSPLAFQIAEAFQSTSPESGRGQQVRIEAINRLSPYAPVMGLIQTANRRFSAEVPQPWQNADEYATTLKTEFKKINRKATKDLTNTKISAFLRKFGITQNINWGELFKSDLDTQREILKSLMGAILKDPRFEKLDFKQKQQLADLVNEEWNKRRMAIFRQEFKRFVGAPEVKPGHIEKLEDRIPWLVRQLNLGTLDAQAFRNQVAEAFGISTPDDALVKRLTELAQEAQKLPEMSLMRRRKMDEMVKLLHESTKFNFDTSLARDIWYGSVLMRVGTMQNVFSGGFGTALTMAVQQAADVATAGRSPREAIRMLGAFWQGAWEGVQIGLKFIRTGDPTLLVDYDRRLRDLMNGKAKPDRLELLFRKGNLYPGALALTKRFMVALDYIGAQGIRDSSLLYITHLNREQDVKAWQAARRRFDAEATKQARDQAKTELGPNATRAEVIVRMREILNEGIDAEVNERAANIAQRAAQNAEPPGISGHIYKFLSRMPFWLRAPLGLAFLRAGLNMAANAADWVPGLGVATYIRSSPKVREALEKRGGPAKFLALDLPQEQRRMAMTAQMMSLSVLGFLVAEVLADPEEDEDKRRFDVSGGWVGVTPQRAKERRAAGEMPYAVKVGNKWISYKQSPLAPIFATVGYWRDLKRNDPERYNEENAAKKIVTAWMQGMVYVKDIAALSGATQALGLQAGRTEELNAASAAQWLGRTVGRAAGGFVPSIIREIDEWMDPQRYTPPKDDLLGAWIRNVPFARRSVADGRPDINFLGEPIKFPTTPARGWVQEQRMDDVGRLVGKWMGDGLFLPYAGSTAKIVDRATHKRRDMNDAEKYVYAQTYGATLKSLLERQMPRLEKMNKQQAKRWLETIQPTLQKRARAAAQKVQR